MSIPSPQCSHGGMLPNTATLNPTCQTWKCSSGPSLGSSPYGCSQNLYLWHALVIPKTASWPHFQVWCVKLGPSRQSCAWGAVTLPKDARDRGLPLKQRSWSVQTDTYVNAVLHWLQQGLKQGSTCIVHFARVGPVFISSSRAHVLLSSSQWWALSL